MDPWPMLVTRPSGPAYTIGVASRKVLCPQNIILLQN